MGARHAFEHAAMRNLFWRLWWADGACWSGRIQILDPGLHFWAGPRFGNVRIWGTDFVLQALIVALTLPGLWLASVHGPAMREGLFMLLAAQPLWLIASWRARQFGMLLLGVFYTAIWLRATINAF